MAASLLDDLATRIGAFLGAGFGYPALAFAGIRSFALALGCFAFGMTLARIDTGTVYRASFRGVNAGHHDAASGKKGCRSSSDSDTRQLI